MIKFIYSTTTINLNNPNRNNVLSVKKYQSIGRTAAGVVYTYDKGITTYIEEIEIELRESEKTELMNFYLLVNGVMNTFTYITHKNETKTARFLKNLEFTEIESKNYTKTTYVSGGQTYPTHIFDMGIYVVKIELEVNG